MADSPVFHMDALKPSTAVDNDQLAQGLHFFESLRAIKEATAFAHELIHERANAFDSATFQKRASELREKYSGWLRGIELTPDVKPAGAPLFTLKFDAKQTGSAAPQGRVRGCIGMRIRGTIGGVPVSGGAMVCLDCGPDPDTGEQDCYAMWSSWD